MENLSRSERVAMAELELRTWMTSTTEMTYADLNIHVIHRALTDMWTFGPVVSDDDEWPDVWNNFEEQPPWKPTLQDVEDHLPNDYGGKLLKIMNYQGCFVIESLDVEIDPEHIEFVKDLCDEFDCDIAFEEVVDEVVFDQNDEQNDEVYRILNLQPSGIFQDERNAERMNNCRLGLEIIESIMEKDTQTMDQGEFIKLCNIFKELS